MLITVLFLAGGLLLFSLLTAALYYPVKVKLSLFDGDFSAKLSYLFYHITLADTRFPVDVDNYTNRKWKKERKRLCKARSPSQRVYHVKSTSSPKNPVLRFVFYFRLITRFIRALGAENVPRLSIYLTRLSFRYGTGNPNETALLHGVLSGELSNFFTFLSSFSRFRIKKEALCLSPDFWSSAYHLSFSVTLSMPLFHYFSVFHSLVPNSERALLVLAKRKEKLEKKKAKSGRKRGLPTWLKTVYRSSSPHL